MLAAGAGMRMRPLTLLRPKVLCPLGDRPLVDHAIDRFAVVTDSIAVNIHAGRDMLESHLAGRVHLSFEEKEALGRWERLEKWRKVLAIGGFVVGTFGLGFALGGLVFGRGRKANA